VTLSRASLDRARSDVVAAEAGISVARSDARRAEALLGYTRIVAPFDGVVTRRNVDAGHLTVPGGQGEPLFIVARSDLVTVTVGVPELFAAAVDPGDSARVRLQAIPGRTFEGKVTRTAYALDTKSRTLRVEIDLPNPVGKLHPGLYAYATIILDEHRDALTLPASNDFAASLFWELRGLGVNDLAAFRRGKAEKNTADIDLTRVQAQVARDVVASFEARAAAVAQIEEARASVTEAIESLELNFTNIRRGAGLPGATPPIEVLQPIQALAQARADYLAAVLANNRAQFRLYRAIGQAPLSARATTSHTQDVTDISDDVKAGSARSASR
jgi:hypothetical protein